MKFVDIDLPIDKQTAMTSLSCRAWRCAVFLVGLLLPPVTRTISGVEVIFTFRHSKT